jgi:hypothetical protein
MNVSTGLDVQALIYTGDPTTNVDLSSLVITIQGNTPTAITPEPSSLLLMGTGLLALVGAAKLKLLVS